MTRQSAKQYNHLRPIGADDAAKIAAIQALSKLTEREVASFALGLLLRVDAPVLCDAMGAIGQAITQHAGELRRRASAMDRGQ